MPTLHNFPLSWHEAPSATLPGGLSTSMQCATSSLAAAIVLMQMRVQSPRCASFFKLSEAPSPPILRRGFLAASVECASVLAVNPANVSGGVVSTTPLLSFLTRLIAPSATPVGGAFSFESLGPYLCVWDSYQMARKNLVASEGRKCPKQVSYIRGDRTEPSGKAAIIPGLHEVGFLFCSSSRQKGQGRWLLWLRPPRDDSEPRTTLIGAVNQNWPLDSVLR